jgi:hypothetical protein
MRRRIGQVLSRRAIVLLWLCLGVSGCKVTHEDIDTWTGTVKGPGKIVAVLLSPKYEDELRTYAGVALVRMEPRENLDGVNELQAAVEQLPDDERTRLVDLMAVQLIRVMRGEDAPQAGGSEGTPARQLRAKDAAFLLIPHASTPRKRELTEAIVDWFVVDFNARSLEGNFTAEQVVRRLGAPAASRLVNALNANLPQQALVKLAEMIATLGDAATKTRAAERLVAIEREMESDEYTNSLKERLRAQLRERDPNAPINEQRVANAANVNREAFINLGALPAMKHLNRERVIQDRLLELAQVNSTDEAILVRRKGALLALEGGTRADQVDALLDIAFIPEPPPLENQEFDRLRDAAFDRVSDVRATTALPRLWTVFSETESWRTRWRVGSLILTIGGPEVVQEFFTKLDDESYAQEELAGYAERMAQMRPPPTDFINTQLESEEWFDRVVALYFWERRATAADLSRITDLEDDGAQTEGEHWDEQNTVGKVAEALARSARERLQRESGGQPEAGGQGAQQ